MAVKQGLDLTPYSKTPNECELLLQHGTLLLVRRIDPPQPSDNPNTKYKIYVEQILVKEGAKTKWAKLEEGEKFSKKKHERMDQPEFEKMMQWSRAKVWRDAQQEVTEGLAKLRDAYPYTGKQKDDIRAAHDKKMEHFNEVKSDDFAKLLDKIDNEADDKARKTLVDASVKSWQEMIDRLKSQDKFITELDANPFVKVSIRGTINRAAEQLNLLKF